MPEGFGPIADYDELVRSILATIHRRDLESECAQWIAATELELFRDCKVRPGEQILTGTFVGGETQIALPYGTIETLSLELTQGETRWTPGPVSLSELHKYLDPADGLTRVVATFGDAIQLAPSPAAGITYRLFYRGMPAPISQQNKTTRLFEMGWDAYLYGALLRSAPFIADDERIGTWAQFYAASKESLKRAVWRARAGPGPLVIRPDFEVHDRHNDESSI